MTSPPDSARFFNAIASRYDRAYALSPTDSRRRMARVERELPEPPATILDLGVGTGRELTALLDAGYAPTGLDASEAMLERCARRSRPVPLIRADFWSVSPPSPFPFDDASFDAAIALHGTLAHPPDSDAIPRLAQHVARVLRRGGRFIAEVPSPAWLEHAVTTPARGDCAIRRTGARSCIFEDNVVGASIAVTVLDDGEWKAALAPIGSVRVEPIDDIEWLVVGHRD